MAETETNSGDQSWRTALLRQNVRNKIEETIRMSGNPTSKTVEEMENHIFLKARTKEEYLSFVARLILHVKEMDSKQRNKKRKKQTGMQQIFGLTSAIIPGTVPQQPSDPMSVLQNMAGPQPINDISNGNAMHLSVNSANDAILVNNPSPVMMSGISQNIVNPNQISIIGNINPNAQQMNQNRVSAPMAMSDNGSSVGSGSRTTNEEQVYLEKLRSLQKYVDSLRKIIARIDQDDRYSNDRKKELDKMKNLLSILTDPSRRCPMATLGICEQFLEKMDFTILGLFSDLNIVGNE